VGRIERALDPGQYALGTFFDIQGALDNTPLLSVQQALGERKVILAVRQWISAMIAQRTVSVNLGQNTIQIEVLSGLPQGGGLSPTLWFLVADILLCWLTKQGVFAQGFADDELILIIGKVLNTMCEIMHRVLQGEEKWCTARELSVNPIKTKLMLFTRKYKPDAMSPIFFYNQKLDLSTQVKYLGVIFDPKLYWRLHIETKRDKALASFYQLKSSVGKSWGITPKVARWMYTAVIRHMITYAAVVWWPRVEKNLS